MDFLSIDAASIDVNVLYLVLLISLWVGVTAAYVPGTGLLEGIAAIGLLGSLLFMAQMPVNWIASFVLVIGVAVFLIMPFLKQRLAAVALTGLALQAAGSVFLFNDGVAVSPFLILFTLLIQFGYYQWVLVPILQNISHQPSVDRDMVLIGAYGRVVKEINPIGTVNVNSELWTATSDKRLKAGDHVVVLERSGLQLVVEGIKNKRREEGEES